MADTTFHHATIGPLKPNTSHYGVLQFQGIQYATLTNRFAPAQLKTYSQNETINATQIRPQVLSIAPGPEGEFGLLQHSLDYDKSTMTMSDTEGLCLNVTVPIDQNAETTTIDPSRKLPVFVFIHGGGFNVGSGMYPQYNMSRFVSLSVKIGQPIITVVMNYRLGAPGLLTSRSLREKGYLPNNALRDQRTALQWVQRHIGGFGGDAENLTLGGESAGGISVCYHLFSKERLFKRMVSMSGTQLLAPPISQEEAEGHYERAIKALGLQDGEEAVEALTKGLEGKEMAAKLMGAGIPSVPVLDGGMCPTSFTFQSTEDGSVDLPGNKWCEAALIGDCQFDGNIQGLRLAHRKSGIGAAFCAAMSSSLSSYEGLAERLCSAYGIDASTPDDAAFEKVLQVANDINFYLPTLSLARNLSTAGVKTFMYRFNEPNPWPGSWQGHATHILDLTFLLQNFNEFLLDERQRGVAEEFGKDVIWFIRGADPWHQWRKARVFGEAEGWEGSICRNVEDLPGEVGRRDVLLRLAGEEGAGVDVIFGAFDGFLHGK